VGRTRDRTAVRATHAQCDLFLLLTLQPVALPVPIDSRVEALGILDSPDLLPNDEVLGVQLKGTPPLGQRRVLLALFQKLRSKPQPRLDQLALDGR